MKLTNVIASFAAGMIVLGTSAYGQTTSMKAEIPFAFSTPSGVLPAGVYTVRPSTNQSGVNQAILSSDDFKRSVIVVGSPKDYYTRGNPAIVFFCGEAGCALRAVRLDNGTTTYPSPHASKRDKEVAILLTTSPGSSVKAE
jgi:hypothetical protein